MCLVYAVCAACAMCADVCEGVGDAPQGYSRPFTSAPPRRWLPSPTATSSCPTRTTSSAPGKTSSLAVPQTCLGGAPNLSRPLNLFQQCPKRVSAVPQTCLWTGRRRCALPHAAGSRLYLGCIPDEYR
eukprot:580865-Pleurochrysis_carterae.AAC.1